jgi:hypothetical protein
MSPDQEGKVEETAGLPSRRNGGWHRQTKVKYQGLSRYFFKKGAGVIQDPEGLIKTIESLCKLLKIFPKPKVWNDTDPRFLRLRESNPCMPRPTKALMAIRVLILTAHKYFKEHKVGVEEEILENLKKSGRALSKTTEYTQYTKALTVLGIVIKNYVAELNRPPELPPSRNALACQSAARRDEGVSGDQEPPA